MGSHPVITLPNSSTMVAAASGPQVDSPHPVRPSSVSTFTKTKLRVTVVGLEAGNALTEVIFMVRPSDGKPHI